MFKDVLNSILKSNITLIGYDFRNEVNAHKIINLIPNKVIIESNLAEDILNVMRSNSFKRERILTKLFEDSDTYIIININGLIFEEYDDIIPNTSKNIRNFMLQISKIIYEHKDYSDVDSSKFKVICLTQTYQGMQNQFPSIRGGSGPLHISDFVMVLEQDRLKVIKDRQNSSSTFNIPEDVIQEFRDYQIESLFNEE